MSPMKSELSFAVLLAVIVFLVLPLGAEDKQEHAMEHNTATSAASGTEAKPLFEPMPGPGKKVPLGNDYYFIYGFNRKPKVGKMIVAVQVYRKSGEKDTSMEIELDAVMPSMKGAYKTVGHIFKLSRKGNYLCPINLVKPGEWEIRLTFSKGDKVVFRGSHRLHM